MLESFCCWSVITRSSSSNCSGRGAAAHWKKSTTAFRALQYDAIVVVVVVVVVDEDNDMGGELLEAASTAVEEVQQPVARNPLLHSWLHCNMMLCCCVQPAATSCPGKFNLIASRRGIKNWSVKDTRAYKRNWFDFQICFVFFSDLFQKREQEYAIHMLMMLMMLMTEMMTPMDRRVHRSRR